MGLFPVLFAAVGLSIAQIGVLAALYPAVWGLGQLVTGAWSDRVGRKPLIVAGMLLQALALVAAGGSFGVWAVAAVLLGAGTAMVYPTLLAATACGTARSWPSPDPCPWGRPSRKPASSHYESHDGFARPVWGTPASGTAQRRSGQSRTPGTI